MRRGRRLSIDVGDARIGVASCDPDGILATPVETVPGRDGPAAHRRPSGPALSRILRSDDRRHATRSPSRQREIVAPEEHAPLASPLHWPWRLRDPVRPPDSSC